MRKVICSIMVTLLMAVGSTAANAATETVRLHYVPSLYAAPLFVAQEKGFFEQNGLKVDMKPITAVTESVPLLSSGQIDVATGGYGAGIFSAIKDGIDIRIVAPMGVVGQGQRAPNPLLVRKGAGITSIKQMKGKRVACAGGLVGGSGFQLIQILETEGVSGNDVILNNLRFPDQVVALTQGAVDAAMSSEPFATKLIKDGVAVALAYPKPGTSVTGLLYSGKFMKERPQAAKNFMVALMKGFRDVQGDKFVSPENLQIFNKYTKVATEIMREVARYDYDPDLVLNTATLLEQQAVYMRYGALKYSPPLKPEQFVDETYIKHALSVLGPYKRN